MKHGHGYDMTYGLNKKDTETWQHSYTCILYMCTQNAHQNSEIVGTAY